TRPRELPSFPTRRSSDLTNYVAAAAPEGIKVSDETIFHEDEYFRSTLQRNQFYYYDPEADEITPVQRAWLKDYVNRFETALYGRSEEHTSELQSLRHLVC